MLYTEGTDEMSETNTIKALRIANGLLTDARENLARKWVVKEEASDDDDTVSRIDAEVEHTKASEQYTSIKKLVRTLESLKGERE